jgi:putative membrane protein
MIFYALVSVLVLTVSLVLTSRVVPGVRLRDSATAFAAGAVLWLLRLTLGKALMVLCLPLCLMNRGLASVLIHAVLLRLTARFVKGFQLEGYGATLLAALSLTLLWRLFSWLLL